MPTGSLCAERNVIGSALASDLSLRREDILAVAVLSVPMSTPTTAPSSPMSQKNPIRSPVTQRDTDRLRCCQDVECRCKIATMANCRPRKLFFDTLAEDSGDRAATETSLVASAADVSESSKLKDLMIPEDLSGQRSVFRDSDGSSERVLPRSPDHRQMRLIRKLAAPRSYSLTDMDLDTEARRLAQFPQSKPKSLLSRISEGFPYAKNSTDYRSSPFLRFRQVFFSNRHARESDPNRGRGK